MVAEVPQYLTDFISVLKRHSAVRTVSAKPITEGEHQIVEAQIHVHLPSRAKARGESSTGVRDVELVRFEFKKSLTLRAPIIGLRRDFPLNLPHINPYSPGDWVRPCVYAGSLTELMYLEGPTAVVDQVVTWLHRAASGALINPSQGWEYVRRDEMCLAVEFDADHLVTILPSAGGLIELQAQLVQLDNDVRIEVFNIPQGAKNSKCSTESKGSLSGSVHYITSRAFLAAPSFLKDTNSRPVFDTYEPETVKTVGDLITKASSFQIDGSQLLVRLNEYYNSSRKARRKELTRTPFRVIVILAVQRPYPMISSRGNSVELLTYVLEDTEAGEGRSLKSSRVWPAIHVQSLSPSILRATSGTDSLAAKAKIAWLGVGSLGSKVALHLARGGFTRHTLVDRDFFSPHNEARHALWDLSSFGKMFPKALLMAIKIQALTFRRSGYSCVDAAELLSSPKLFEEHLAGKTLIVDSTASLAVMEAACLSARLLSSATRYVRTALLANGKVCFVAAEGIERRTRIDDLMSFLYAKCRTDAALRMSLRANAAEPGELFLGQSCSSVTTIMPDSSISRSAASVAMKLENWLHRGIPADGTLSVGIEDADGIGMCWTTYSVPATTVLATDSDGGWDVRITSPVVAAIESDARHWGRLETGGALLGHVYQERRTIVIADLVAAPEDSGRSENRFTLGVNGLAASLLKAHEDTCAHLRYIGTWHSHPTGGSLSGTDISTLNALADEAGGLPMVLVVWTPDGLLCKVASATK